jgi:membrane dipeptidase
MVRVAGEDHVGFGSDFDGVPQLPHGLPDCTALPVILERLAARGVGERTLRKIAWENFLRVWRANA